MASAHYICPSQPSDVAIASTSLRKVLIGGFLTTALRQQGTQPQHRDIARRPTKINGQIFFRSGGLIFREIALAEVSKNISPNTSPPTLVLPRCRVLKISSVMVRDCCTTPSRSPSPAFSIIGQQYPPNNPPHHKGHPPPPPPTLPLTPKSHMFTDTVVS